MIYDISPILYYMRINDSSNNYRTGKLLKEKIIRDNIDQVRISEEYFKKLEEKRNES
jgi:hypothetical protein